MQKNRDYFGTFFSLTHYAVHKFDIAGDSLCDKRSGRATASVYYVVSGHADFTTPLGDISVGAGELLYIPRRQRYTAKWTGDPNIVFYGIDFGFELRSEFGAVAGNAGIYDSFCLQKPDVSRFSDIVSTFEGLLASYRAPETRGFEAVVRFYTFFGELLEVLDKTEVGYINNAAEKAAMYIEEHCTEEFYADELAALCGLSVSGLYTVFKKYTGVTPVEYKNNARIRLAQKMLVSGHSSEEIADALGFSSAAYFRKVFKNVTGMLPGTYRKNHTGYINK